MSEETRKDIETTVNLLKELDRPSLLLVKAGAEMLKARQEMEEREDAKSA